MQKRLEERWLDLWRKVEARGDPWPVYANLMERYGEIHRHYHNLAHIKNGLNELDETRHLANNPNALEFAWWFHDAVYNPASSLNEEKSAELALEIIKNASLPRDFSREVASLIMATKHREIPLDQDAKIIMDIDLASLGEPEAIFEQNTEKIQKEFGNLVSKKDFIAGRAKFLKHFLERQSIYFTRFFREKYEEQARKNLTKICKAK